MKIFFTSILSSGLFASTASATEPGLDDARFKNENSMLFVSTCHYAYELTSLHGEDDDNDGHMFYMVMNGESGVIIRERRRGFTALGSVERVDDRWFVDISSIYTSGMTGELKVKFLESDFFLIAADEFKLSELKEKTQLCGTQRNPHIEYYDNRHAD